MKGDPLLISPKGRAGDGEEEKNERKCVATQRDPTTKRRENQGGERNGEDLPRTFILK